MEKEKNIYAQQWTIIDKLNPHNNSFNILIYSFYISLASLIETDIYLNIVHIYNSFKYNRNVSSICKLMMQSYRLKLY